MKIERLIGIVFYILNRENVSANKLAQYFNVSRRTILRDIDTLTLAGIPIYSEVGAKGGYSINRDYKVNEKIIDTDNSQYILLALESLKTVYGDTKVNETYEKVKHLYPNSSSRSSVNLDFSIVNENETIGSYVAKLREAVEESRSVEFNYTNIKGRSRVVKGNILQVLYKWYSWYCFGYDLDKKDFRMFKIARISNLEVSNKVFNNNYNLQELLENYHRERDRDNINITIEYSKEIETLVDEYFKGNVIDEGKDYKVKNVIIKENDFILFSIILGFGEKLRVTSPLWYRKKIKEHLEKTLIENFKNSDI